MQKSPKFYALIVAIVFAIFGGSVTYAYKTAVYNPLDKNSTETISIIIHRDDTARMIGNMLQEKEIIKSSWSFYWYIRWNNFDEKIIPGRFKLSPSMNIPKIAEIITDPAQSEAVITINEGLTIQNIDDRLYDLGLIEKGEFVAATKAFALEDYPFYPFLDQKLLTNKDAKFISPLEGYLFPDTYFLDPTNFTSQNLIYKCLNNFKKKTEELIADIKKSKHTLHEILTMASIIEKEVKGDEDRAIVSGILWKRLDSDWRLDADATALYAKDNPAYNTRKIKGLPPGPIGNPSLSSIKAALNPKSSPYWFYLSAKDGKTIYSKTNEEHNQNKAKYL